MDITLIILSILCWLGALVALPRKILLAPALSYCGMLIISFAKSDGYPIVPLSTGLTLSWLAITLIIMLIIILQNPAIRQQSRGVLYMTLGALAGMCIGLLGFSLSSSLQLLYALMIIGTAVGIYLGMLVFTSTPDGAAVRPTSGHFFRYLLAKGFPILITVAQIGIVAVILIAGHLL